MNNNFISRDRITVLIILLILGITLILSFFPKKKTPRLEIIANLIPLDANTWSMRGRILNDGDPVADAKVWAVLDGDGSNEDSPPAVTSDQQGGFKIDSLPRYFGIPNNQSTLSTTKKDESTSESRLKAGTESKYIVREIRIYAKAHILISGETTEDSEIIKGKEVLTLIGQESKQIVNVTLDQIIFLPTVFLISIIIPFLGISPQLKYRFSLTLAFLLTVALIVAISRGINFVSTSESEILSFGFIHVFQGTYVPGVPAEWLFSFTSPGDTVNSGGFGVPLWVLLLSVIGSSLFTVLIIVSEIKDRPNFKLLTDDNPVVYQLMVLADAVGQPITVAIAALGAGSSMNIILDKAVTLSKSALEKVKLVEAKSE
ncbi:MAG: hypothetical protein P8X73_18905 [Ignavibacteriaceae bacterium]